MLYKAHIFIVFMLTLSLLGISGCRQLTPEERQAQASREMGKAYIKGDFASAIQQQEKVVANQPDDFASQYFLARLYIKAGRKSDAIALLERLASKKDSQDALIAKKQLDELKTGRSSP